jgi:ribosomal protein S18 acetylase RimI-like enzyme
MMELTHTWARNAGYRSISLHVFGGNHTAINLYRSLGYETTDLSMRRDL